MDITLERESFTKNGVFGNFKDKDGNWVCATLERAYPDADDPGKFEPKIPVGQFKCIRRQSPHFKCDLFKLQGVTGHEFIEIHVANVQTELDGCIAVGEKHSDIMLESSKSAFHRFMDIQSDVDEFLLTVL